MPDKPPAFIGHSGTIAGSKYFQREEQYGILADSRVIAVCGEVPRCPCVRSVTQFREVMYENFNLGCIPFYRELFSRFVCWRPGHPVYAEVRKRDVDTSIGWQHDDHTAVRQWNAFTRIISIRSISHACHEPIRLRLSATKYRVLRSQTLIAWIV